MFTKEDVASRAWIFKYVKYLCFNIIPICIMNSLTDLIFELEIEQFLDGKNFLDLKFLFVFP